MILIEKVTVAIISSLILSLVLAIWQYSPESGWGFFVPFLIYFIYSAPVYLVGGTIYSAFIDVFLDLEWIRNRFLKYITELVVYAIGGMTVIILWFIILSSDWNDIWVNIMPYLILGVFAALLFFHISLGWKKIWDIVP